MKRVLGLLCMLIASQCHAQWGGFLDPEIMRKAGKSAATGNFEFNNMQLDGRSQSERHGPSAAEVAREIRSQQERQKRQDEARAYAEQFGRVQAHIERGYAADYGK